MPGPSAGRHRGSRSSGSSKAFENTGARDAFLYSLKTAAIATAIALVLGTLASLGVARYKFFGRETISFLVILPIALPGIVTGIALNSTFTQILGITSSLLTHRHRPRDLLHRRRLQQRDRSAAPALELLRGGLSRSRRDALADISLGDPAEHAHRARRRRLARLRALLRRDHRHGHSRSESASETLPIWILNNFSRPNQLPIVNVVAVIVILLSIIPVYFAHKLSSDTAGGKGGAVAAEGTAAP